VCSFLYGTNDAPTKDMYREVRDCTTRNLTLNLVIGTFYGANIIHCHGMQFQEA
jgi:hypothetical protein